MSLSSVENRKGNKTQEKHKWTDEEIIILLQLTKIMINFELKDVIEAFFSTIRRCPSNGPDKKLRRMQIFSTWKERNKQSTIENIDRKLEEFGELGIKVNSRVLEIASTYIKESSTEEEKKGIQRKIVPYEWKEENIISLLKLTKKMIDCDLKYIQEAFVDTIDCYLPERGVEAKLRQMHIFTSWKERNKNETVEKIDRKLEEFGEIKKNISTKHTRSKMSFKRSSLELEEKQTVAKSQEIQEDSKWSDEELVALLQLAKIMINCEMKQITEAFFDALGSSRPKRAAEYKLRHMKIFSNWKERNKKVTVEKIDRKLEEFGAMGRTVKCRVVEVASKYKGNKRNSKIAFTEEKRVERNIIPYEWTDEKLISLLQLTKRMINCSLKEINDAFLEKVDCNSSERGAEKKLKKMNIFTSWKERNKQATVENIDSELKTLGALGKTVRPTPSEVAAEMGSKVSSTEIKKGNKSTIMPFEWTNEKIVSLLQLTKKMINCDLTKIHDAFVDTLDCNLVERGVERKLKQLKIVSNWKERNQKEIIKIIDRKLEEFGALGKTMKPRVEGAKKNTGSISKPENSSEEEKNIKRKIQLCEWSVDEKVTLLQLTKKMIDYDLRHIREALFDAIDRTPPQRGPDNMLKQMNIFTSWKDRNKQSIIENIDKKLEELGKMGRSVKPKVENVAVKGINDGLYTENVKEKDMEFFMDGFIEALKNQEVKFFEKADHYILPAIAPRETISKIEFTKKEEELHEILRKAQPGPALFSIQPFDNHF